MDKAKSFGLCTCNENGNYEVSWELESTFVGRFFGKRTEFRYEKIDNDWFDMIDNSLVVSFSINANIQSVIRNTASLNPFIGIKYTKGSVAEFHI